MDLQEQIILAVTEERARQDRKWGTQRKLSPQLWMTILMEEVGEVARASLEDDPVSYASELTQVAAVAVAALESHYTHVVRPNMTPDERPIVEDTSPDSFNPVEGGETAAKYVQERADD